MFQKVLGILLQNKSLGSTWNKMDCGIQDGGFCNFVSTGHLMYQFFLWWIKTWAKVCRKRSNARLAVLFLWRKALLSDDREINTASETPALTKKTCKFQGAWKDKYKWLRFDGKENKMVWIPKKHAYSLRIGTKKFEMIRVIRSFADGLVNFNPTGPAGDQTQNNNLEIRIAGSSCHLQLTYQFILRIKNYVILQTVNFCL